MKKRITSVLIVLMFAVSLIGCAESEQTSEKGEAFVPTPLVIETKDREPEIKQYHGTVKIVTPYKEVECWAGVIQIQPNGNEAEVTVTDAVECVLD